MPLKEGTTAAVRGENIATELRAGKDPKQAEAIGYAAQRRAADAAMDSSLPLTVSQAETVARNRKLWEQPGGCPPELDR